MDLVFLFNSINNLNDYNYSGFANIDFDGMSRHRDIACLFGDFPDPHTELLSNSYNYRVFRTWNIFMILEKLYLMMWKTTDFLK